MFIHAENGNGLNFIQEFRPAEDSLDTGGRRQRLESLFLEECRTLLVKGFVVSFDIAQITTSADDVVPGGVLAGQESGDVLRSLCLSSLPAFRLDKVE